MAEDEKKEPKIIVDDDWKAQAQAEKERLAEQIERGAESPADRQQEGPREIPPASFAKLISSIVAQTLMTLGGVEDPKTKRRYVNLDLARHHIDTLSVIEEKTKGNLSDDEKKLLDQALYETRMQYVQVAQRATKIGQ